MSNRKYDGDGALEQIDPARLTLGNVLRSPYRSGLVPAFGDSVVIGIRVDLSTTRQNKGLGKSISCETLAGAMKEAKEGDYVVVTLARPYLYSNNPFLSMPSWLVGCDKHEVMSNRIQDTHKVVVNATGEYACFNVKPTLHSWEVVVGNVGSVYRELDESGAYASYKAYVDISKEGYGRAGGESVTLFRDGEIVAEHVGTKKEV